MDITVRSVYQNRWVVTEHDIRLDRDKATFMELGEVKIMSN